MSDPTSCSTEAAMMCASCGSKENEPKLCTACRSVRYCNRQCQIRHRPKHKAECIRIVASNLAAMQLGMTEEEMGSFFRKLDDMKRIKSFVPPPPPECPLCAHTLPIDPSGSTFNPCCGYIICYGCEADEIIAAYKKGGLDNVKKVNCAFCRAPKASGEENVKRALKRADKGDIVAMRCMADGICEQEGRFEEGIGLYQKAADGGDLLSAYVLGVRYTHDDTDDDDACGCEVEKDTPKGLNLLENAANGGLIIARYALGCHYHKQKGKGDMEMAMAHFSLAARGGSKESLKHVTDAFVTCQKEPEVTSDDHWFTKEEYSDIIRSFQGAREELDSESRRRAQKLTFLNINVQDY